MLNLDFVGEQIFHTAVRFIDRADSIGLDEEHAKRLRFVLWSRSAEGRGAARDRRARRLKYGRRVLCQAVRVTYAFIDAHPAQYPSRRLYSTMTVHPSGYYAWKQHPVSARSADDRRGGMPIT